MTGYTVLISSVLVLILVIQKSPYLWPGIFFLIIQLLLLGLLTLLTKYLKGKWKYLFSPVLRQFRLFFNLIFPIWIGLALTGDIATSFGRIYAMVVAFGFFVLIIVLLIRFFVEGSLLDEYENGRDDRYDH